jgi:hypothetical protein
MALIKKATAILLITEASHCLGDLRLLSKDLARRAGAF